MSTNASSDSKSKKSDSLEMWLEATKELFIPRLPRAKTFALFAAFVGTELFRCQLYLIRIASDADPLFLPGLIGGAVALVVATSFAVTRLAQRAR